MIDIATNCVAAMLIVISVCVTLAASVITMAFIQSYFKHAAADKRDSERISSEP